MDYIEPVRPEDFSVKQHRPDTMSCNDDSPTQTPCDVSPSRVVNARKTNDVGTHEIVET